MQQNMYFQGVHFFPLLQFEQPSVLRPPTHVNTNVVRIIKSAQNNGHSLIKNKDSTALLLLFVTVFIVPFDRFLVEFLKGKSSKRKYIWIRKIVQTT